MAKWVGGQLKGKVVVRAAIAIGVVVGVAIKVAIVIREEIIKKDKEEI